MKKKNLPAVSHISAPPSPAPEPANAASPSYNGGDADSFSAFDVRKFGAKGDGVTDDTDAFKMAWDAACDAESATLLIPRGHAFMIQSTIFTGPCKANLVFQVIVDDVLYQETDVAFGNKYSSYLTLAVYLHSHFTD